MSDTQAIPVQKKKPGDPRDDLQSLLKAAEAAEKRYDHETAVAHYTTAMELPNLTPEEQQIFLNGRAEAYRNWGSSEKYAHDVLDLIALLRGMGDKKRLAEAMANHGGGLIGRSMDPTFFREAVTRAEEFQNNHLLSLSLLNQGRHLFETGETDASWQKIEEALDIARRSADKDALFRTLIILSAFNSHTNQPEEAQRFAFEARRLAVESDNLYWQTTVSNISAMAEVDFARKRTYWEKALSYARTTNNQIQIAGITNNISYLMWRLGLYGRALAFARESLENIASRNDKYGASFSLDNLGRAYLDKGALEDAQAAFEQGFEYSGDAGRVKSFHSVGLGEVALAQGHAQVAICHFEEAVAYHELQEPNANAAIGIAYLVLGDLQSAIAHTRQAVDSLETGKVLMEFPQQEIWWRHYQVLLEVDPGQAFEALDQARETMIESITTISDEGLRRNYLNKVAVNRDITLVWTGEAARRSTPLDTFTAHKPQPGNLEEQFRRVIDIGARLAAEHNPAELADFLIEEFVEMSGAERALLLLLDDESNLQTIASFNPEDALELASPLLEEVQHGREPILRQNVGEVADRTVPELHQRSLVALPLIAQGRLLGLLYGDMRQIFGRFDEGDKNLLGMLANQAAAALENADLVSNLEEKVADRTADLEQRNNELAIINSVQEGLAAELDLQAIFEIVGEKLREIYPDDSVSLSTFDLANDLVYFPYLFEEGESHDLEAIEPGPISRHLIETMQPLLFRNRDDFEAFGYFLVPGTVLAKSAMYVPLVIAERPIGMIGLENHQHENAYDESDVRLLTTLANSMSVTLENARLFDETQQRAREMASLAEVGRDISATLELTTVLERIAGHALDLLDISDSVIFLPDESGEAMRALIALGNVAEQMKVLTVRPGTGILGDVWQRRQAELLNDPNNDPRSITIEGTEEEADERLMVTPLFSGEDIVGLMAVWRHGDHFSNSDLQFLDGLARQAAIAIQNAQLYSDAELARAAAIEANESKSAFLSNMSHELRTPLNAIIGFSRIVSRKSKDCLPQKQQDNLSKILSSGEHLLGLINTILDIAKIEAGRMDVNQSRFQVGPLLENLALTAQPLLRRDVIFKTAIAPDLPPLVTDQDKVKQILLNLLSNAAKFTHEGSITITARPGTFRCVGALREAPVQTVECLAINVADTGIGISEEALGRIFEEFQQADDLTRRHYGGTGLGLSISKQLAHLLGGDITAESQPGQGSTFTLFLPLETEKADS